jgi:phosphohistidine phosphatase
MKEIIVVRHAKSDWGTEGLQDIDRCLNERGYSDAYRLANWFSQRKKLPDLILTSSATRALSTAFIFVRAMHLPISKLILEPSIYEADTDVLLNLIRQQNEAIHSLMIFGHNPGLTDLCNALGSEFSLDNLPTCGMVFFQCDCNKWKDLKTNSGKMKEHVFPKEFKN